MKHHYLTLLLAGTLVYSFPAAAQNLGTGSFHGNFELNAQYYAEDDAIGTPDVPEKIGMNSFVNLLYSNGNLNAGLRYEAYLNPMLGFDAQYQGNGIPYRFVSYKNSELEFTVGNFYEQFGNGLILRSYEEKTLGIDNSLDGARVRYTPVNGITLKGLIGNQRKYWEKSDGLVRGADVEINLNDLFSSLSESKTRLIIGGSAVSKYEKDDPSSKYKLPGNVAAFAGRMDISMGKLHFIGEYAYKINDPSFLNHYIYKPGEALFVQGTYSKKGLGITLAAKRIDNMNFRSERNVSGSPLTLSYLPPLTRQHAYSLANVFPYASQPNGEIGYYADFEYKFKKGSLLGGTYGTDLLINFSSISAIDTQRVAGKTEGTMGYTSDFFRFGDSLYFRDFNIEITHKFNKALKGIFSYLHQRYDLDVVEGHAGAPMVKADIFILEATYRFNEKNALRTECQLLFSKPEREAAAEDVEYLKGDWAQLLLEYTIAPNWFFTVMDQYNYKHPDKDKQLHYYLCSLGYTKGTNRISVSYGRQRAGILCVGGVCRAVPASNGFQVNISSNF